MRFKNLLCIPFFQNYVEATEQTHLFHLEWWQKEYVPRKPLQKQVDQEIHLINSDMHPTYFKKDLEIN